MPRRRYLNFTTSAGVSLASLSQGGSASFLLHDTGYLDPLSNWNHPGVDSPFWRLYHNPRPGCHLRFQDQEIPLVPDKILLIPANTVFDCCSQAEAAHFWIHFSVNWPSHFAIELRPISLTLDTALNTLLADTLAAHHDVGHPLRLQRLQHLASAMLHLCFSRMPLPVAAPQPDQLSDLLALIEAAPNARLDNPTLARRTGMSQEGLIRWFRRHTGHTPAAYVAEARVRLAKQKLALTGKSIEQISLETGFPNRHYFSRVFAKQVGCGPAEFRKRQRERKGL